MPDSYYAEKFHGILTDLGKKTGRRHHENAI